VPIDNNEKTLIQDKKARKLNNCTSNVSK